MLSFTEYCALTESLATPHPWRWVTKLHPGPDEFKPTIQVAEFRAANGKPYEVTFAHVRTLEGGRWDMEFTPIPREWRVTHTGDAPAILSTVVEVLRDFIAEMNPREIHFTGKEESRQKLYDRMMTVVPRAFPAYQGRTEPLPPWADPAVVSKKYWIRRKTGPKESMAPPNHIDVA